MSGGSPRTVVVIVGVVVCLLLPAFGTDFFIDFVMTRTMILGIVAATVVFLSSYAGMISLAQLLIFGVSGFMIGNAVAEAGHGLKLGWNPWISILFALGISTAVAFLLGAIGSRTIGIYYLMLTLTYGVIGYFFFAQVTTFSGFGGVTGIDPPEFFLDPKRQYYLAVILSVLAYAGLRAVGRTTFGLALQGIRDDPVRMASLGFNVPLHRTLAFTMAGFVAAIAGVLNVWWNGSIAPTSIAIGPILDILIIAVIGGISSLEGAWLGALVWVAANNYLRDVPLVDNIGITEARFNTIVGVVVLVIMVLSPEGLTGIIERIGARLKSIRSSTARSPGGVSASA